MTTRHSPLLYLVIVAAIPPRTMSIRRSSFGFGGDDVFILSPGDMHGIGEDWESLSAPTLPFDDEQIWLPRELRDDVPSSLVSPYPLGLSTLPSLSDYNRRRRRRSWPESVGDAANDDVDIPVDVFQRPRYRKTGTTIAGVICDGGRTVVLGADTRATDGSIVADKRCEKVHRLAPNVWCCGAGTSGDIDALVRQAEYTFLLRGRLDAAVGNGGGIIIDDVHDGLTASATAVARHLRDRLTEAGGGIGANLVLGGYDAPTGRAVLAAIHPHGSMDVVPYAALGSGGLAATAILEARYKGIDTTSVDDAVQLVVDAISAGIANDLGSGSQVDVCVVGERGVEYRRAAVAEEDLPISEGDREADEILRRRHIEATEERGNEAASTLMTCGVNGFGSPYAVTERRVVMRSEEAENRAQQRWLEGVLGQ